MTESPTKTFEIELKNCAQNFKVKFEKDKYIVSQSSSNWTAHFTENSVVVPSDKVPNDIGEEILIKELSSSEPGKLFHQWSIWKEHDL